MKYLILFLLIAGSGCAHHHANEITAAREPANAGKVYLNTASVGSEQQELLLSAAEGRRKITAAQTTSAVSTYGESPQLKEILKRYAEGLYQALGIDPRKSRDWIKKNTKFYKGISNYVGSSDESMADEGPSWQSINFQLREGEKMSSEETAYLREILDSLAQMPVVSGLSFRGMSMTKALFEAIPAKGAWEQRAFTSTSLDPSVALAFGSGHEGHSQTGVLILKLKKGYPVSPLTFDHGHMGQPGRFDEFELLLPPGRTLFVHGKLEDPATKTYYVFAEEK